MEKSFPESFPTRLRYLRERKRPLRTMAETADFIGIGRNTYWKYEKGEAAPSFEYAAKIAKYFGVSLDYLYYGRKFRQNSL